MVVYAKHPFWTVAKAREPRGDEAWIHKYEVSERVEWFKDQLDLDGEDSPDLKELRIISEALSRTIDMVEAQIQAIQDGRKASSSTTYP